MRVRSRSCGGRTRDDKMTKDMCARAAAIPHLVALISFATKSLDVRIHVAARSKLILLISSSEWDCSRACRIARPVRATTPISRDLSLPLISAPLMRWPSGRDDTREIPADITMRRDVSQISLFSARRNAHEARGKNGKRANEGALHRRQAGSRS